MILPHRERNGRRQRLPRDAETLVARIAAQPHRRGERTNAGATPWQRAIKAGLIRATGLTAGELEQAGLALAEAQANFRKAISCGSPYGRASGSGSDIPQHLIVKWRREWEEILIRLRGTGRMPFLSVLAALDSHPEADERSWGFRFQAAVGSALAALNGHFRGRRGTVEPN
jgi:hypothetical protein